MAEQEKKQEKSILTKWRFRVLIVFLCCIFSAVATKDSTQTTKTSTTVQKVDEVQQRIDRINELYSEEPTFEKVVKLDNNSLGIYFTSTPDIGVSDSIDSITRGQAVNLSNEVNGVASVKTFVGGESQMFCIATKGTITNCNDYR